MPRLRLLALLTLAACAEALPGDYFEVTLTSQADTCNDPTVPSEETWTYRLVTEGDEAAIFIDDALMASGSFLGCNLSYRSPLLTERREDGTVVRWSIDGAALVAAGEGCDAGDGWLGTETITIVSSSDEEVFTPGCSYAMEAEGRYLQTID